MNQIMKGLLSMSVIVIAVAVGMWDAKAAYPEKPIKIIVPYAPGGSTDVLVRLTAQHLEPLLGQPVVVVNIKGAGGSIGMFEAAKAKPDGYTYGMYLTNTEVSMATGVASFKLDDLQPVALLGDMYLTVTGKGDGPFENLTDMQAAAKKNPGEISIAMGQGMLAHFAAAMVEEGMGVDLKLVNVGGGAKKRAAVLGGHVDTMAEPTPGVQSQHKAGQLRILGVLAPERLPFLPDIPTAKEQGFDIVSIQTNGFFAPKGTPQDRVDTFAAAVKKLSDDSTYQDKLKQLNLVWNYKDPEEMAGYMQDLNATINGVAKDMGLSK
jgi:tripartite-type tricarboxylate transporter receptor subunit TctC